jgi:hypothetical protein
MIMEFTNINVKAIFTHSNENVALKGDLENLFVETLNYVIQFLNEMYETWNAEYGEITDRDDYEKYIEKKTNEFLRDKNIDHHPQVPRQFMRIWSEDGDLYGISDVFNDKITLSLKIID